MKKIVIAALILSLVGVSGVFAQSKGTDAKADTKTAAPAKTDAKADTKATDVKATDVKTDAKAAPADAKAAPAAAKPAGTSLYTDKKANYEVIGDAKGNVIIYDKNAVVATIEFVKLDGKSINITYNKIDAKVATAADVTAQLNGTFGLKAYAGGAKAIYDFWSKQGAAPAAAPKKK